MDKLKATTLRSVLPLFLLVFQFQNANTQDVLSLRKCIEIALDKNYSIQVLEKSNQIAKNNVTPGNAGMLPIIDASGNAVYSNNNSKLELATGQSIDKDNNISQQLGGSIDLNWTIFDGFGMFMSYDKLKTMKELNDIEMQLAIENTVLGIVTAYYQALKLQTDLKALEENLVISRERLKRLEIQSDYGSVAKIEVLRAEVDLNRDSSTYLQTDLSYQNAKRNLNYLMGREPSTEFILDGTSLEFGLYSIEFIRESAEKKNSSINQALVTKELSNYDYKMIKSTRYPRIMLNSSYGYNKQTADAGIMTLNQSRGLTAGVTASFNLFNGFKTNLQAQNAKIGVEISELQYQDVKNEVETNIQNAYDTYVRRIEIYELEKTNLTTAEKNYERSNELYKLGQITSLELREAQNNLLLSKNTLTNALLQVKIAEAELMVLAGLILEQ